MLLLILLLSSCGKTLGNPVKNSTSTSLQNTQIMEEEDKRMVSESINNIRKIIEIDDVLAEKISEMIVKLHINNIKKYEVEEKNELTTTLKLTNTDDMVYYINSNNQKVIQIELIDINGKKIIYNDIIEYNHDMIMDRTDIDDSTSWNIAQILQYVNVGLIDFFTVESHTQDGYIIKLISDKGTTYILGVNGEVDNYTFGGLRLNDLNGPDVVAFY